MCECETVVGVGGELLHLHAILQTATGWPSVSRPLATLNYALFVNSYGAKCRVVK